MGAGSSVLFIDDSRKDGAIGFSKAMFAHQEWTCLKNFCVEHNITQIDLNRVFKKYCTDENAVLRQMRVDLAFFKNEFSGHCAVNKEAIDVFVPQVFLRDHEELNPPHSSEEISFARFVVMAYIFCAQPVQDMVYDMISISRNNPKLQLKTIMYTYNLEQIITVLSEETEKSASLDYCLQRSSVQKDAEISIDQVMRIAMKYPIAFFQLVRVRKKFQRCFLGDRFWQNKSYLPSRCFECGDGSCFSSEKRALLETARAIVLDFESGTPKTLFCTGDLNYENDDYVLSTDACRRLKESVGYRAARALIQESQFKYEDSELFMSIPHDEAETLRAYDPKVKKDFMYNVLSGFRSWVDTYRSIDGTVVREECFRPNPKHLVHFDDEESDSDDDDDDSYYSYYDMSSIGTRSVRSKGSKGKSVKTRGSKNRKRKNTNTTIPSQSVASGPMIQPRMMF